MRTLRVRRAETGERRLLKTVRKARPLKEVVAALAPLDDTQRKACLPELRRLRSTLRDRGWLPSALKAVYVAGAGCHTAPAATAQWLLGREFAWHSAWCLPELLAAMDGRSPGWYADVAHRLAARPSRAEDTHRLAAELARRSDGPPPDTDDFVRGWVAGIGWVPPGHRPDKLTDRLREDPFLPHLVPRLFEVSGVGAPLNQFGWAESLAELAAAGTLDRTELLDATVSRLLRGESSGSLRFFRDLLALLAPDDEEAAARTRDWVRIAADAPSSTAKDAQQMLRRLWQAGRLGTEPLAEASRGVLFRTERTLVRSQLVLLGKVLGRDRSTVPELLPVVAGAFGHEDAEVQERAWKLVARHLGETDPALRKELAETVCLLGPSLRTRAAEVFGADAGVEPVREPYEELLPPPPEPRRMARVHGTAELVEEVAALANRHWWHVPSCDFERVLDGLVRHAHHDRAALARALRPVRDRPRGEREWAVTGDGPVGLVAAVLAVLGEPSSVTQWDVPRPRRWEGDIDRIRGFRVQEASLGIASGGLPLLLATPDWESGILEPETLVTRLRTYRGSHARPAPVDFEQALLRVRPDAGWSGAAAALGTPEGDRLAAWLAAGGLPAPVTKRVHLPERRDDGPWRSAVVPQRVLAEDDGFTGLREGFAEPFRRLGRGHRDHDDEMFSPTDWAERWLSVVPWHREAVAVRHLDELARGADSNGRGAARGLPALAEAEGEAGFAVHLGVGLGLGARDAEDRLAAVDALLVLAAREQLDAELLGGELGELLALGAVKANRVADALRSVAATGAYGTAWAVLRPLLPGLLTGTSGQRGAGELLKVAADSVERCGRGGEVRELDAVPVGSTRRAREARRLRAALRDAGT